MDNFDPRAIASGLRQTLSSQPVNTLPPLRYKDLYISDKEANLLQFEPNEMQAKFNDDVFAMVGRDWRLDPHGLKGIRRIILKGRQFGFSTNTVGLYFMDTLQRGNVKSIIVAQDQPTSEEIFKKVQLMHDKLPDDWKDLIGNPSLSSKRSMFWPKINATFMIGYAGSEDFGSGQTIQNVLLTEIPKWPERSVEGILAGLGNAVPLSGNIVIESTAKGIGNDFYRLWIKAIDGTSSYKPLFYAWNEFREYRLSPAEWHRCPGGFDPAHLTEDEQHLVEIYRLDSEQLAWRRFKIGELADPEIFRQEYPLTWQEAFLTSGQSYFTPTSLNDIEIHIKNNGEFIKNGSPLVPKHFPHLKNAVSESLSETQSESKYEDIFFHIYEMPIEGEMYAVSADVSEGLNADGKHDFCSASVWKLSNWSQVAHLHGYWDTHNFAYILTELGWFYDNRGSLLIPERNNFGLAVIETIQHQTKYPLGGHGLYKYEDDKYGWPQNVRSRAYALETGKKLVSDGSLIVNSPRTLNEMRTFVKKEGKKIEALSGCFDDCVLELCIFAAVVYDAPVVYSAPRAGGREKFFKAGPKRNFTPPGVVIPGVSRKEVGRFEDSKLRNLR